MVLVVGRSIQQRDSYKKDFYNEEAYENSSGAMIMLTDSRCHANYIKM